jgi:hypothetical protein
LRELTSPHFDVSVVVKVSFTWVITKSQPHADSVVIQLRRQGFDALAVCCIEHRWSDWPALKQIGAAAPGLLFVTSRAAAARVEVPRGTLVPAIAPTTSATLEARGIRVGPLPWRRARAGPGGGGPKAIPWARSVLSHQRRGTAPARTSSRCRHPQAASRPHAGGLRHRGPDNLACNRRARLPEVTRAPLGYTFWSLGHRSTSAAKASTFRPTR